MSLNPTAFWFLRHGETDWNAEGLSQGHTDIPLNAVGITQARRAALALVDRGIATIIASPLSRALHTAEILAEALALPVATDAGLRERRSSWVLDPLGLPSACPSPTSWDGRFVTCASR